MRHKLHALTLALLLATPIALTTGCKSPTLKAYQSDVRSEAQLAPATKLWFDEVVAGRIAPMQEYQFQFKWGKYLTAQSQLKALIDQKATDKAALATAAGNVQATANDVIIYVHTTTGK